MPIRPEMHGHAERKCALCGKGFTPYHIRTDRFCSAKCRKRAASQIIQAPKKCPSCGTDFTPQKSKSQAYCSPACKSSARTRRVNADPVRLEELRERRRAYTKTEAYREAQLRLKRQRREAMRSGEFSPEDWQAILARFGNRCAYCRTRTEKLTTDHVVPLSKGGTHTAKNIVPACQPCNGAKGNRDWSDRIACP